ncbi:hypothetical protein [Vibrio phage CKB-S1]|nr:hypothetical protein [Vibrio phage CKB-S1]
MLIKLTRATRYLGAVLNIGGAGGAGFVYPDSADRPFATIAARNTWAAANLGDLVDGSTVVQVAGTPATWYLWTGETSPSSHDSALWIDATPLIQGPAGEDGIDGTALEFTSLSARDSFFISRPDLLLNGLPVLVNIGNNTVGIYTWTGPTNPSDLVASDTRWSQASQAVPNNSLFVGSTRVSNAVENIVAETADGRQFLATGVRFDDTGSRPFGFTELAAATTLNVNTANTQDMPDPFTVQYTTFGDNLTTDFDFIPAEAGELRAEFFLGADDQAPLIFDERRAVTQAEVDAGEFVSFGVGNPYLLDEGLQLFARFSGVQLRGGVVDNPGTPLDGQTIISFRSTVQAFTARQVMRADEFTGAAVRDLLTALTGGDRLPASAIRDLPAGVTLRTASETADLLETLTGDDRLAASAIRDLPADVDNFVDQLTVGLSGQDLTITLGRTGTLPDLSQTVTLPSGGGTDPGPGPDVLYYGRSTSNNPATVDLATLTQIDPTDPQTVSTGVAVAGDYFIILTANTHDITTITDTVLQQDVTSLFTKTEDVRAEGAVTLDSYVIGPLNAGVNEQYVLEF